jgi:GAF domain.
MGKDRTCNECSLVQFSDWLDKFVDDLSQYQDENTLLDRILAKSREITNADAGTIFLVDGEDLLFAYTHNDSLFSVNTASKFAYSSARLPINTHSIAGYAACTGELLNLADVRALPSGLPFSFRDDFDKVTGYRTESMLVVPFHGLGRSDQLHAYRRQC